MGWPFSARVAQLTAADLLGFRTAARAGLLGYNVTRENALKSSAAWACLRLRADILSMMPVDVYRRAMGMQIEVPKPPVLVNPGGERVGINEWMYSTQFDLDSTGNTFGVIAARDGNGLPARIDLVPVTDVVVQVRKGVVSYRIAGEDMPAEQVWHEKQFTTSGMPIGLSPLASAAATISGYLSAQQFAADWFSGSAVPQAMLRNTAKKISPDEALVIKDRFKASVTNGEVFVTGNDWDYQMISAKASEAMFLEERKFGIGDICRYFGVPGDMIDAESSTGSITYANVTQRNLQLLIMNIGPAVARRETAFSDLLLQKPRYVKLNTDALLRMDLASRYASYELAIKERFLAPSEVRELENRPPYTQAQIDEFLALFPPKSDIPKLIG
jgi:HK97 family phage portal protein